MFAFKISRFIYFTRSFFSLLFDLPLFIYLFLCLTRGDLLPGLSCQHWHLVVISFELAAIKRGSSKNFSQSGSTQTLLRRLLNCSNSRMPKTLPTILSFCRLFSVLYLFLFFFFGLLCVFGTEYVCFFFFFSLVVVFLSFYFTLCRTGTTTITNTFMQILVVCFSCCFCFCVFFYCFNLLRSAICLPRLFVVRAATQQQQRST